MLILSNNLVLASYLSAEARTEKYADDTISYLIDKNTLGALLHQVADTVQQWCSDNRMRLNEGKCKVMHFNGKRSVPSPQVVLGQSLLEVVSNCKYLGIDVNTRLDSKAQWENRVRLYLN